MNMQDKSHYHEAYARSMRDPEGFWADAARAIDWIEPAKKVFDPNMGLYGRWFAGAVVNTCYNALDRHVANGRAEQLALIHDSPVTNSVTTYTYAQMLHEVKTFAAVMQDFGVAKGDRVIIYMPLVPEAMVAMLACARIGAVHSVVFGGFAAKELATRIDDAQPKLVISASCGIEPGRIVAYKPLLDDAIKLAAHKVPACIILQRPQQTCDLIAGRDHDWKDLRDKAVAAKKEAACVPVLATDPLYILYTSGTTGIPKGVVRDNGGHLVAINWSMYNLYGVKPGEVWWCGSDIGWVVGHSYIIYGPLLAGMATIMYEGTPLRPDAGIWWQIVEKYKVSVMFSAPTAVRVLKKQDPAFLKKYDLSSLKHLFLAGEPLDETSHQWIMEELGIPVIDNYWQTETGWPMLAICRGVEDSPIKLGSPAFPVFGYDLRIFREDGTECGANEKGIVGIVPPLPPGCLSTVWGQDDRFVSTYFSLFKDPVVYSSSDWGIKDDKGYYSILGRMDDVINVAGHRLGTREIEEAVQTHPAIAEVAVVGVADELKGQMPMAFAVVKNGADVDTAEKRAALEKEVMKKVDESLGAIARPARVHFIGGLPKTRSGKMLRRSIQALAEGRDPGDLTTIDDPSTLEQIKAALKG